MRMIISNNNRNSEAKDGRETETNIQKDKSTYAQILSSVSQLFIFRTRFVDSGTEPTPLALYAALLLLSNSMWFSSNSACAHCSTGQGENREILLYGGMLTQKGDRKQITFHS